MQHSLFKPHVAPLHASRSRLTRMHHCLEVQELIALIGRYGTLRSQVVLIKRINVADSFLSMVFLIQLLWLILKPLRSLIWLPSFNYLRRLLLPHLLMRAGHTYPKIKGSVQRLTFGTVIKISTPYSIHLEAEVTRFIHENTTIPVPRVHDVWTNEEGKGCLIPDYMPGEMLARVWRQITHEQRRTVMRTLGLYIQELRSLPQPQPSGWIGSPSRRECYDMGITPNRLYGPFPDEKSYNDWRISTYDRYGKDGKETARRLNQIRQEMKDDHRIYFTHGDISWRNVLVRIDGERPEDIRVVALLDWEQGGWRPEYWEVVKLHYGMDLTHPWRVLVREVITGDYEDDLGRENELSLISGPPV